MWKKSLTRGKYAVLSPLEHSVPNQQYTIYSMNTESPKRRGRPPGSNSFAKIKLQDLISMVGENAMVKVSTMWLRENHISIEQKVNLIKTVVESEEPESKISFSVTNFDEYAPLENAWQLSALRLPLFPLYTTLH